MKLSHPVHGDVVAEYPTEITRLKGRGYVEVRDVQPVEPVRPGALVESEAPEDTEEVKPQRRSRKTEVAE